MTTSIAPVSPAAMVTEHEARMREGRFRSNLAAAQDDFHWIRQHQAWSLLGFDTFADWWTARVVPIMRQLEMRPTREVAASVVEQVRADEAELPKAQRRTQTELAEMVGVDRSALADRNGTRSARRENSPQTDLGASNGERLEWDGNKVVPTPDPLPSEIAEQIQDRLAAKQTVAEALDRVVPDPDEPKRRWQAAFLDALRPAFRVPAQFSVEQAAEQIDDECLDELRRAVEQLADYYERVKAARPNPDNVRHLRSV